MTDHGPGPSGDHPRLIAGHSLGLAQAAAERRETKAADTRALLSIAASLLLIADHLDQRPAAPETLTVLPEVERVAGGCCCRQDAVAEDDLLELGFGIISSAEHSISSQGSTLAEWKQAADRFTDAYNTLIQNRYGGSLEQQLMRARAALEVWKSQQASEAMLDGDD